MESLHKGALHPKAQNLKQLSLTANRNSNLFNCHNTVYQGKYKKARKIFGRSVYFPVLWVAAIFLRGEIAGGGFPGAVVFSARLLLCKTRHASPKIKRAGRPRVCLTSEKTLGAHAQGIAAVLHKYAYKIAAGNFSGLLFTALYQKIGAKSPVAA
jgi:hypothetical protein